MNVKLLNGKHVKIWRKYGLFLSYER